MRPKAQGIVLFFLQFDPIIEEILGEDIAFEQEFVISFERLDSSEEGIGDSWNLGKFFRREFIKVLVEWIARVDPVLNAVKTRQQQS